MEELKPCPFCGEKHVMHEQGHVIVTETARSGPRFGVRCYSCGGRIEFFDTEAEAIDAWNSRAERTCRNVDEYANAGFFTCGACGFGRNGIELTPNYCPACGAKVIRGASDD